MGLLCPGSLPGARSLSLTDGRQRAAVCVDGISSTAQAAACIVLLTFKVAFLSQEKLF